MADDGFRLPDSSYDQLVKIIIAYGEYTEPQSPSEVARVLGIHRTSISRNGGFLVGVGILDGANRKVLTTDGRELARALDHEMPEEIRRTWRAVVTKNDFMQKVLAAVRIRKGMEPSALQSHIAYSAGQSKTKLVMRGAAAVIDILRAADLLKEEEGRLVAVSEEAQRTPDSLELDSATSTAEGSNPSSDGSQRPDVHTPSINWEAQTQGFSVEIQIQIQCSPDDIGDLAPKLLAMMRQLRDDGMASSAQTSIDLADDLDE